MTTHNTSIPVEDNSKNGPWGSDLEASYSERNNNDLFPSINSSSKNNDLFPSINSSNVKYPTIHSDEESVDISEHSSVRQFRNIFNKQNP